MEKFKLIETIKTLYNNGENIIQYLKGLEKRKFNTIEDILISYDFQSGSYIKNYYQNKAFQDRYCQAIASVINKLGKFDSIIEAGVGEATTLGVMVNFLTQKPSTIYGFDLSWSRIQYAKHFLREQNSTDAVLFTGDLFEIPLPDNAMDVVYTSHSVEPNGGKELEALTELYRVTSKYLVLCEPAYELASEEARERMRSHGYITNLHATAQSLGYKILEYRLLELTSNPLNPTGVLVIEKNSQRKGEPFIACPISKTRLRNVDNSAMFSAESLLTYPVIKGIPCLLRQNAVLTTHFDLDYAKFRTSFGSK